LGVLTASAIICAALAAVLFFRPKPDGKQTPNPPLKIAAMDISQFRGQEATLLGDVVKTTDPVHATDSVQISATLSAPGYAYLIAFNPDGSEQLCYPEDPELAEVKYPQNKNAKSMTTAPTRGEHLRYPREQFFEPGIPGLQVFVLIASAEPLPPYSEWRAKFDTVPWKKVDGDVDQWRWEFDGQDFLRLPEKRGQRVERGSSPREFRDLCNFFSARSDIQAIRAIAFPVSKK
jgi:hypothetical protein